MPRRLPVRILESYFENILSTTYVCLRAYDKSHPLLQFIDVGRFDGEHIPEVKYRKPFRKAYESHYDVVCSRLFAILEYHDDLSAALNLYLRK